MHNHNFNAEQTDDDRVDGELRFGRELDSSEAYLAHLYDEVKAKAKNALAASEYYAHLHQYLGDNLWHPDSSFGARSEYAAQQWIDFAGAWEVFESERERLYKQYGDRLFEDA